MFNDNGKPYQPSADRKPLPPSIQRRREQTLTDRQLLDKEVWYGIDPATGKEILPEPWEEGEEVLPEELGKDEAAAQKKRETFPFWVPIPGWEAEYAVCPRGFVKSLPRYTQPRNHSRPVWLSESLIFPVRMRAYWVVSLSRSGKRHTLYLHKLLEALFMPPCPEDSILRVQPGFLDSVDTPHHVQFLAHVKRLSRLTPIGKAAERAAQKAASRRRVKAEKQARLEQETLDRKKRADKAYAEWRETNRIERENAKNNQTMGDDHA